MLKNQPNKKKKRRGTKMKLPLISAMALSVSMLVSGSAFAQTMIAGATLTAEELPIVQAHCDTLAAVNATGNSPSNDNKDSADSTSEATAGDKALVTSIELDVITLENCKEAGLVD
jgi:hypothetical protein